MNRTAITQFYASQGWTIPWSDIRFVAEGWFLRLSRLCITGTRAATLCLGKPWEIHCEAVIEDALIVHELCHCWQRERVGAGFWMAYYGEHFRAGYSGNKYEVEARECERRYKEWIQAR